MKKIPVGIIGATGIVGQQYVRQLLNHPWFSISFLAASERSRGKTYLEAIGEKSHCIEGLPDEIAQMRLHGTDEIEQAGNLCRFIFSAVGKEAAMTHERLFAARGIPVISNASYHRLDPDVPMIIPEVNPHHSALIPFQQKRRNWAGGFIAVKPNCSIQSYVIPLAPLHEKYTITKLAVTTLQAVSGAGYPGMSSLDMIDNIIPYIPGEEEKSELEPLKIFGAIHNGTIEPNRAIRISAHCNRVPVLDGHMATVSVEFATPIRHEEILDAWHKRNDALHQLGLPSAPKRTIIYREEPDRPQPRLDRNAGQGMSITVGRLRPCPLLQHRFAALSHNTIRGAAGGGVLIAELLKTQGYL